MSLTLKGRRELLARWQLMKVKVMTIPRRLEIISDLAIKSQGETTTRKGAEFDNSVQLGQSSQWEDVLLLTGPNWILMLTLALSAKVLMSFMIRDKLFPLIHFWIHLVQYHQSESSQQPWHTTTQTHIKLTSYSFINHSTFPNWNAIFCAPTKCAHMA